MDPITESRRLYAGGRWRHTISGSLRTSLGPLGYLVVATLRRFLRGSRPAALTLDLGGGEGLIGVLVAGTESLVVIDAVEDAVRVARTEGARVIVGDVRSLPVRDGTADVVLSSDVLEHLRPEDAPTAVAEMARVLKSGGIALVHTSVYGHYLRRWLRPAPEPGRLDADDLKDGHLCRFNAAELRTAFNRAGFTVEKYIFYKHFFQPLARLLEDAALIFFKEKRGTIKAGALKRSKRSNPFIDFISDLRTAPAFLDVLLFGRSPGGAGIFRLRKR